MKQNVILLTFLLCTLGLWGQNYLSEYSFSYSVSPYLEITDGTLLGSETTDDEFFVNITNPNGSNVTNTGIGFPIGFNFLFSGHSFDKVGINANGWLSLGDSSFGANAVNMNSQNVHSPLASQINSHPNELLIARIAGFGRDLQGQAGSSIRIKQQGTAPNRSLIVQWKHYRRKNTTGESFNFQICLKEQGMQVSTQYQLMQSVLCTGEIGLRAAPAATAENFANRTTSGGWASSQAGTAANNAAILSSANQPESGASFSWSPVLGAGGQANFTANITSGPAPLTVQFSDLSLAGTNPISSWQWNFGGQSSTAQNPLYCFNSPGLYTISLTISDAMGNTSTETKQGYINVSNSTIPGLNTSIQMQGNDAVISWNPINVDENGFTPQYYFLYFNGCSTLSEQFYFLAPIPYPQTTYTHAGVGLGATRMMYQVRAVRLED